MPNNIIFCTLGKERKKKKKTNIDKLGRSFNEQVIDSVKSYGDW